MPKNANPPYGQKVVLTRGSREVDGFPTGLYPGLVGHVPKRDYWTQEQRRAWSRGLKCLVHFDNRAPRIVHFSFLRVE